MKQWEEVFPESDKELFKKLGTGIRQPFGNRPALLIIDVVVGFIGSKRQSVVKSVEEFRTSCGEAGWVALDNIQKLLQVCRSNNIPVIYTAADLNAGKFAGGATKSIGSRTLQSEAWDFPDAIAPLPSELVIHKTRASGFFQTPLATCLSSMGIDSLLVVGTSTSGCVRASVVDAFSHGLKCFIVEEGTFDRFKLSHLVNLFDMNLKYANVITLEEALKYVAELKSSRQKVAV